MTKNKREQKIRDISPTRLREIERKKKKYEFAKSFFILWKAARMHNLENTSFKELLEVFIENAEYLFDWAGGITLSFDGNSIKINDLVLRGLRKEDEYLDHLAEMMLSIAVAEIIFPKGIEEKNIVEFLTIIKDYSIEEKPDIKIFNEIQQVLANRESRIRIISYIPEELALPRLFSKAESARELYKKMIEDYSSVQISVEENEPVPLKDAVRNIQKLIDFIKDSSKDSQFYHFLFLATLSDYRAGRIASHSTNTAILSCMIGVKAGLDRRTLKLLVLSAYLHDAGIGEILEHDMAIDHLGHTEKGFKSLSRMNIFRIEHVYASICAASHHDYYDFDASILETTSCLYSGIFEQIVRIADFYDLATRYWPEINSSKMSRIAALCKIFENTKTNIFRKETADAMLSVLGIFPPGSILKIQNENLFAVPYKEVFSTTEKVPCFVLDNKLSFIRKDEIDATLLFDFEQSSKLHLPSATTSLLLNMIYEQYNK